MDQTTYTIGFDLALYELFIIHHACGAQIHLGMGTVAEAWQLSEEHTKECLELVR